MKPDLVNAVCKLVDAVFIEHCLPVGTEGHLNEEHTVESALALLREIRAAPELPHGTIGLIGSSPTQTSQS